MKNKELMKMYKEMTKDEAKEEVRLLKEEYNKLYKQILSIEKCLEYLNHKLI